MRMERVCILGGSGFVGRHLANRLARQDICSRVPTRRRERSRHMLIIPRLELIETDIHDQSALTGLLEGVDAVINLVGILNESGRDGSGFRRAHVELTESAIAACRAAGVRRYLHMSALGADAENGPSFYQKTKGESELLARAAHGPDLAVTIFRPSVIFGPEDSFFNRFAGLLRIAPGVFPLPTPHARFAPVYVGDVTEAYARCLTDRSTYGQTYDLCGPKEYTLKELVDYTARMARLRRIVLPAPDWLSRLQARLLGLWPTKPYSMDNYLSATVDNVSKDNGLPKLGVHPTAVETIVPAYLGSQHARGRYNRFRQIAGR
ncbi:MAG: complex I NDUFA9 subunit family protein [Ectothiorhodospiraceae bacterium]|nr:complex I NDUFA9 subunit family protein [Ectothiorhodospiraceae bacterium]MCH8504197.1 complex I NDUFA9 subunit family protein [Ectothiorhodospiraceae bacterium]